MTYFLSLRRNNIFLLCGTQKLLRCFNCGESMGTQGWDYSDVSTDHALPGFHLALLKIGRIGITLKEFLLRVSVTAVSSSASGWLIEKKQLAFAFKRNIPWHANIYFSSDEESSVFF